MFPELFKIPFTNFSFNTYGVLLAAAFLGGMMLMARLAARDGLDKQKSIDLGLWVLAASLIGSKALMVITEWDYYSQNPGQILSLDFLRSGGVYYGGFLGAVIASVIVMRYYKLPWWRTSDAFAPGIILGQAIGRLGCFSAGCCWGKPTTAWYGVHFSEKGHEITGVPVNVALHPTQLYEAAAALLVLVVLLLIHRRRRFEGQVILAYAMLYSVVRFTIEFWRDDPRGEIYGLSTSQFIAIILFAGALPVFIYRLRKHGAGGAGAALAPAQGVSLPEPQAERAARGSKRRAAIDAKKEDTENEITQQIEGQRDAV
ncbi:MAG TPA: prolipoprotein diacylglyceryl transferase [Blastocatellia bacterium]|nr:prolipoprotein diacylglyceryl transferase [Blastocatellia bacterium]